MNVRDISIGELAERAGCTVQIIRHYEKIGLLPDTRRTSGNRRIYSEDQASRLIFIRHSRITKHEPDILSVSKGN
jgi:DNA-binding transcriptional MerR regulator